MDILFELEDDYGAHGLTDDWAKIKWVCRQHNEKWSATTRPESGEEDVGKEEQER